MNTLHCESEYTTPQKFNECLTFIKSAYDFLMNTLTQQITTNNTLTTYKQTITSLEQELFHIKNENDNLRSLLKSLEHEHVDQTALHDDSPTKPKTHSHIQSVTKHPHIIHHFEYILNINSIHSSWLYSPIQLHDSRIATCSWDKSICVISINFTAKSYTIDIKKENAHTNHIYGLCELDNNRLISCSGDSSMKIWKITKKDLTLLKKLTHRGFCLWKAIPLTNRRFALCSEDKHVKVYNSETYLETASLPHDDSVYYMLLLQRKKKVVTSCASNAMYFWDVTSYKLLHVVKGVYTIANEHMVELVNGHIAVSSSVAPYHIVVINCDDYSIVKRISDQMHITSRSALCVVDEYSFVYVWDGKVVQVDSKDGYKIVYKTMQEKTLHGLCGVVNVNNGEYLVITNKSNGLAVVKVCYDGEN